MRTRASNAPDAVSSTSPPWRSCAGDGSWPAVGGRRPRPARPPVGPLAQQLHGPPPMRVRQRRQRAVERRRPRSDPALDLQAARLFRFLADDLADGLAEGPDMAFGVPGAVECGRRRTGRPARARSRRPPPARARNGRRCPAEMDVDRLGVCGRIEAGLATKSAHSLPTMM